MDHQPAPPPLILWVARLGPKVRRLYIAVFLLLAAVMAYPHLPRVIGISLVILSLVGAVGAVIQVVITILERILAVNLKKSDTQISDPR